MSILVVDDTEEIREIFEAVLSRGGYQDVITLDSATAAFSFLELDAPLARPAHPVDLMLLDIVMPDIDGIQACARIRRDSRYAGVPIIMTTSRDDSQSVDDAFNSGATDYITKPLKLVDFLARIRSTLSMKEDTDSRDARQFELMQHVHCLRFESLADHELARRRDGFDARSSRR